MKLITINSLLLLSSVALAAPKAQLSAEAEFAKADACQQMFPESTPEREFCFDHASIALASDSKSFVIRLLDDERTQTTCNGVQDKNQSDEVQWTVTDCW